ncbi:MADS-box domain-containing protein [Forsythia ovata]|uniref:MADS-box domain-containing protein n=1 Tax=Forsythia ovata TaxID=205694 RepID=A0ABD1TL97_9LAMI
MVIKNESDGVMKKKTQGRKKIEIKKIEKLSNRQVTFSKRRVGLFQKASELCAQSGAEIAIIVHSIGKRVFSFGHPSVDSVINRFEINGSSDDSHARDYSGTYKELVAAELEAEKRLGEMNNGGGFWWDAAVEGLELEELERYMMALEELKKMIEAVVKYQNRVKIGLQPNTKLVQYCSFGELEADDGVGFWSDSAVEGLQLEELERYMAALEELRKNVYTKADNLMIIQTSSSFSSIPDQGIITAPRAHLPVAKGRADRAQHGGVQGSNPEILYLCPVASGSYQMVNSLGLFINFPPWLLGGTSCDLLPPPKA